MQTAEHPKRIKAQVCPFCKQEQEVILNGMENIDGKLMCDNDRGYSFCNCKNILFTDWSNMEQSVYNPDYVKKYEGEEMAEYLRKYLSYYKNYLKPGNGAKFLEMGTVNEAILDQAKELGFDTWGSDFFERESPHQMIFGDWEKVDMKKHLGTFQFILASHIFEHFQKPLDMLQKAYDLLEERGRILIAMPDPYFIDWKNPYVSWGHLWIKEHHIMWDLDSWAQEMELLGFKILIKKHNITQGFICGGDFHIIGEKL